MFAPRLTLALLLLPATLQAYAPYNTPTPSADALNSPTTATGNYYSIELQDVTVNGLTCTRNLAIYKTIAGSVTSLGGMAVPCKDGMTWRVTRNPNFIFISNDLGLFWYTNDADIATGQPGFGARNLNTAAGTITYTYSATNNDGRITGMSSTISGETVTYAYDSLKRLITASAGSQWGLSFSYDGFGNRLSQNVTAGTAPTLQQSYDMATNRLLGQGYDNNGNMTSMGTFDAENRLVNAGTDTYYYAIDNKRIYKSVTGTINTEEVYFCAGGRRIATYQTSYSSPDAGRDPAMNSVMITRAMLECAYDKN